MPAKSWNQVLRGIEVDEGAGLSIPTKKELQGFAATIKLPKSYVQFITRFGGGELSGWCRFWTHTTPFAANNVYYNNLHYRHQILASYDDVDPIARHLVLFGKFYGGMEFGWAPQHAKRSGEYPIYAVSRFMDDTYLLAKSFPAFIADFCMGQGLIDFCFSSDPDSFSYQRNLYETSE